MIRPPNAGEITTSNLLSPAELAGHFAAQRLRVRRMLQNDRGLQIVGTVKPAGQPEMAVQIRAGLLEKAPERGRVAGSQSATIPLLNTAQIRLRRSHSCAN